MHATLDQKIAGHAALLRARGHSDADALEQAQRKYGVAVTVLAPEPPPPVVDLDTLRGQIVCAERRADGASRRAGILTRERSVFKERIRRAIRAALVISLGGALVVGLEGACVGFDPRAAASGFYCRDAVDAGTP